MINKSITGHLLTLFTVVVWATTFVSTKVLLNGLSPIEILFIRFAIGFLILSVIYPKRLIIKERKRELLFVGAAIFGVVLYFIFENIALTYTMASNASVIVSTAPIFTALISHIVFKEEERLNICFFIGFVLAIIGICFISFGGSSLKINPEGDLLAVMAALSWAVYSVITKKISNYGYNTIQSTRRIFIYGIIIMAPLLPLFGFDPDLSLLHYNVYIFNILFLGILASGICFVTWNMGLKILGPVKTCAYIYAQPVITIVFSYIILNERLTAFSIMGAALTLAGLVLSEIKVKK